MAQSIDGCTTNDPGELIALLNRVTDPGILQAALGLLGRTPLQHPDHVDAVMRQLRSDSREVRAAAVRVLSTSGSALRDRHGMLSRMAIEEPDLVVRTLLELLLAKHRAGSA